MLKKFWGNTICKVFKHQWSEFEMDKPAKGKKTRTCQRCGATESELIAHPRPAKKPVKKKK
jgi:hypothetical protein